MSSYRKHPGSQRKTGKRHFSNTGGISNWIYGRRPVLELLRAGRRQLHMASLLTSTRISEEIRAFQALFAERNTPVRWLSRPEMDDLCDGGNHQGVAIQASPYPYSDPGDILELVQNNEQALVLLLDHIEDPQNLGSLLRTADAAGVQAVIIPANRAAHITPAVTRASTGASEHLSVARVVNLVRTMKELQQAGVWITGLSVEGRGMQPYTAIDFRGRTGIVVGGEGAGLSRLVRETCDFIGTLPMLGEVASLNAGVAGAVVLYEILRQRGAGNFRQSQR